MMKLSLLLSIIIAVGVSAPAQNLSRTTVEKLRKEEDSMKNYSREMIIDKTATQRFSADSVFIRMLVRSLRTPNSFYYPFDSLETVSRIYAPDSSFRIFSWQWTRDDDYFRQRGAIQMKTADGSLQLYPLLDMSEFTAAPQDSVRNGNNWIGAIYYGIVMKTFNNKKYYTLLGYDDNNRRSTKKWMEVLSFDERNRPVFGGPFFDTTVGKIATSASLARYCLEYKKDGRARMNYDKDMDMIVYDHLVSESNEPAKQYTMVPDGDYQGFKWTNGKWVIVDKIFDYKLKDGQAPMPAPIKDASGHSDEMKLLQQSEKNRQKELPVKPQPKAPVKKPGEKKQAKDDDNY
jgi:outer membrane lipoprotein-sorting protein